MKKEMCTESVSRDKERMLRYKTFAVAFSYPGPELFSVFPELSAEKEQLSLEYDRLFRAKKIWLYGVECQASTLPQRANYLSDIMGFYRAFGLEPDGDRPDSLSSEMEFMYYLIFKKLKALEEGNTRAAKENEFVCLDAQKKFFSEHLYPAATKIAQAIISGAARDSFYADVSREVLDFMKKEKHSLGGKG